MSMLPLDSLATMMSPLSTLGLFSARPGTCLSTFQLTPKFSVLSQYASIGNSLARGNRNSTYEINYWYRKREKNFATVLPPLFLHGDPLHVVQVNVVAQLELLAVKQKLEPSKKAGVRKLGIVNFSQHSAIPSAGPFHCCNLEDVAITIC